MKTVILHDVTFECDISGGTVEVVEAYIHDALDKRDVALDGDLFDLVVTHWHEAIAHAALND